MSKHRLAGDGLEAMPPRVIPAASPASKEPEFPTLTLNSLGTILAANRQAARLLGKPVRSMVGLCFGDWIAPGSRAEFETRVLAECGDIILRLRSLAPGRPTSTLREAVCLAFADSSRFFPNQSFRLSFSRFPDVLVESSVREVIGGWISFLAEVAGDIQADLEVWSIAGDESLEIWLSLAPAGPDDSERFELKLLTHRAGHLLATRPQIGASGSDLRVCLRLPVAGPS